MHMDPKANKGFTVIEVVIGLFIAVVASLYAAKIITSTNRVVATGRDTFIAVNLAHEGIDLTRAMRENAWLNDPAPPHADWMSEYGICTSPGTNIYTIDQTIVRQSLMVGDGSQPILYIQANNISWSHTPSAEPTLYSRLITADCTQMNSTPAYVTITSTVSWNLPTGGQKSVSLIEELYNWY